MNNNKSYLRKLEREHLKLQERFKNLEKAGDKITKTYEYVIHHLLLDEWQKAKKDK